MTLVAAAGPCCRRRRRVPTLPQPLTAAPSVPPAAPLQAALPAGVFQSFVAALKPKQQQRLQEVLQAA